jgi:lactate dehydrogenase-like 2-hydroxyacid dehydrogenase
LPDEDRSFMTPKTLVSVTRRLPPVCEQRLAAMYEARLGDDAVTYTAESLAHHATGAAALLVTPSEPLNAVAISALPASVRVISTSSVGFEHIDLAAAKARGIRVTHTPDVLTDATADVALLLILAATRRAGEGERMVRAGAWTGLRPTFFLGRQITGKRLGIVGMGRIGAAVAKRAQAFGMKVLYHNRKPAADAQGATFVAALDDLLAQSDVLSLHCPLTRETQGLLNAARVAQLPHGAIVINTARGGLVNDDALIAALSSGKVWAAGLDVYANEPALDPRYLKMDNVFLLPHIGSATIETRTAMSMLAIDNIVAVLDGIEPPHALV